MHKSFMTRGMARSGWALVALTLGCAAVPGGAQQEQQAPAAPAAAAQGKAGTGAVGARAGAVAPQGAPKAGTAPTASAAPKAATADDNPFPEEQSQAAQKQATADDRADREAAKTGGVKTGGAADEGSSSRDKLAGMDILGERDSRISNGAGGTIVDPKLSLQDVKVGQQYFGMGNYQGAYERFKEACLVNPDNLEAVFYLAEAARRAAHLDESAENYRVYLAAQPSGAKAKQARKALAQLEGK